MKSKDQLLLEQAYAQVGIKSSQEELKRLVELDQLAIEQLIEEGLGDYLKKAGGAIKGGVQKFAAKAKETLSKGMVSTVVNAVMATMPDQIKVQLLQMIAKGTVPPETKQIVDQISKEPGGAAPTAPGAGTAPVPQTVTKESLQQNKEFFASIIFTESNVVSMLEALQTEGLLITEAVPGVVQPRRSGQELLRYAREVVDKINAIYPKNKKALVSAMPQFISRVSKGLNIPNVAAPAASGTAPVAGGTPAPGTAPAAGGAPLGGTGLIGKIIGFVKKHPKISAGVGVVILGLVVSAFAGVAPVLVPALITACKGALIGGGQNLIRQIIGNKLQGNMALDNINFKAAGQAALSGAVIGAISSVLMTGLGNITGMFDKVILKQNTINDSSQHGYGETHKEITQRKGLGSFTGNTSDYITTGTKDTGSFGNQGGHMPKIEMPKINR